MFDSLLDVGPPGGVCPGGDAWLRSGSRQHESNGTVTGECIVCRGRFRLLEPELVPAHRVPPPLTRHSV
jgi:hypothetical protein